MSRCGVCGFVGHDRRTCEVRAEELRQILELFMYKCGVCGKTGHNRRSCPDDPSVDSLASKILGILGSGKIRVRLRRS